VFREPPEAERAKVDVPQAIVDRFEAEELLTAPRTPDWRSDISSSPRRPSAIPATAEKIAAPMPQPRPDPSSPHAKYE
jgi:hypothetical protein